MVTVVAGHPQAERPGRLGAGTGAAAAILRRHRRHGHLHRRQRPAEYQSRGTWVPSATWCCWMAAACFPRPRTAPWTCNQLPQGIIGNVEIITGGASAVYGSDAVSGVVNLKTRAAGAGLEIATTYGTTESLWRQPVRRQCDRRPGTADDNRGNIIVRGRIYPSLQGQLWLDSVCVESFQRHPVTRANGEYAPGTNAPSQTAIDDYFAQYGAPAGECPRAPARLGLQCRRQLVHCWSEPDSASARFTI